MSNSPRILIAGAGPVGLTAALELHRRGFHPRIIDKAAGPAGESRALGIHARTLEILEPAGVTPVLLERGNKVTRAVFRDEADSEYMRIDFALVRQKYNFTLILPQSETEKILLGALGKCGLDVEWNTELKHLKKSGESVRGSFHGSADGDYDIVIGCDGARSTVREQVGIGFAGEVYPHDWQLCDVRFSGVRPVDELRIKTSGSDVIAYFPFDASSGRFVSNAPDLVDIVKKEVDVVEMPWISDFRISHRIVETYQSDNVFLAGDAAHIHSPVGGRGMNLGIEDAATLAWLIENRRTAEYTAMRRPLGRAVLKFTDHQTRQLTSGNSALRFARRRIAPILLKSKAVQRSAFRKLSGANTPRPPWLE